MTAPPASGTPPPARPAPPSPDTTAPWWRSRYAPNGSTVATASDDNTARIWDPATGNPIVTLTGHAEGLSAVAFSPDGATIATASQDGTARIWDAITGNPIATLTGHTEGLTAVAYAPDGTSLVTTSDDGTARLWDIAGDPIATLLPLPVGQAVLLPDGSYKLDCEPGNGLWWAIKLCRFEPGELDPYVPGLRRVPSDQPLRRRPT